MATRRKVSGGSSDIQKSNLETVGDNSETEPMAPSPSSKFHWFLEFDELLTAHLSVCADENSKLNVLRPVMKGLEISCHGVPWLVGVLTMLSVVERKEPLEKILNLFLGLLTDLLIVGVVKMVARRQRPGNNKDDMTLTVSVDNYSLPSGHATRAIFLALFLTHHFSLNEYVVIFIHAWSWTVVISRVLLGRHHVSDVLLGAAIGSLHYHSLLPHYWQSQEACCWLLKPFKGDLMLDS